MSDLIQKIHHCSLVVADTNKSLAFYCGVLGLAQEKNRPDLGYEGAWLMVGLQQIHLLQLPSTHTVVEGLHGGRDYHVAFHVTDLDQLRQKIEAISLPYTESKSGRKALFCRDPDGNALEFIQIST